MDEEEQIDPERFSSELRGRLTRPRRIMTPFLWYGGKGMLVRTILPLLPKARVYVEPFCGAASMLFHKSPSEVEVINDLDGDVVNAFRVLQDPGTFREFAHRITWTPYSLAEFRRALEGGSDDPVDRAWRFWVRMNQGFSGIAKTEGNWSRVFIGRGGMSNVTNKWVKRMPLLEWWHRRLTRVQIDCRDALEVIRYWDSDDTAFYLDPPYVHGTRVGGGGEYSCECSDGFHEKMIDLCLSLKGQAMLSGYEHPLYERLTAAGWEKKRFDAFCFASAKTRGSKNYGAGNAKKNCARTEVVWIKRNGAAGDSFEGFDLGGL